MLGISCPIKSSFVTANIQFVLKQNFENSQESSWLEDQEILKHLKIFLISNTNKNENELIETLFYNNMTSFVNDYNFTNLITTNNINSFGLKYYPIVLPLGTQTIRQLENNNNINAELVVDVNGQKIYNIYIEKQIILPAPFNNPEYLSFYFGTVYDLSSFIEQEISEASSLIQTDPEVNIGDIKVETVIKDFNVLPTSFIFLNKQDGIIWTGQVHMSGNQFKTGKEETPDSLELERIEIQNYKVQDYRQNRLNSFLQITSPDLDETTEILNSIETVNLPKDSRNNSINNIENYLISVKDKTSISDGFTSIDSTGNVSITFFIDLKKMFLKNSIYGQILSKSSSITSKTLINLLYKITKIENIRIYRKRIDIDDSLFSKKENKQLISENNSQTLQQKIKRLNYDLMTDRDQLLAYSFSDNSLINKKGKYKYYLEIDYNAESNIQTVITNELSRLTSELKELENFYNFVISPQIFDYKINRFKRTEIENVVSIWPNYFNLLAVLKEILRKYFSVNNLNIDISNILINGTPQGIFQTIQIYNKVINIFQKIIFFSNFVNNSLNEKGDGNINFTESNKNSVSKINVINRDLNCTVNLDSVYKLEYLNDTRQDNTNTSMLFGNQFYYENLKVDLISKKFNESEKLTIQNNINALNIELLQKIGGVLSEHADLIIDLESNVNSTNQVKTVINSRLNHIDRQALNSFLLSLLAPTVDKSEQKIKFNFDTTNYNNIYFEFTAGLASISPSGTDIFNLIKNSNTAISVAEAKLFPNQIKHLIKQKFSSNTIGDAQIRFGYEMLKQVEKMVGFDFDKSDFKTYNLQNPLWKNFDSQTINNNATHFCRLKDYYNDNIRYKFNECFKEQTINEFFIINPTINNFGSIVDGVTMITNSNYRLRCERETIKFFNTTEPAVGYLNINDSYTTTLYSYLSPHGIQFDNYFKVLTSTIEDELSEQIPELRNPEAGGFDRIPPIQENIIPDSIDLFIGDPRDRFRGPSINDLIVGTDISTISTETVGSNVGQQTISGRIQQPPNIIGGTPIQNNVTQTISNTNIDRPRNLEQFANYAQYSRNTR